MTTGNARRAGPLRVVLVDDAVLIREGIAGLLRRRGVEVVAEVGDPDALLRAAVATTPDVAVIDIRLPPTYQAEGIHAAVELHRRLPGTGVLLLSQYLESHLLAELLGVGAQGVGYLLKERVSGGAGFVAALHRVAAGGCVVDPRVVALMLDGRHRDDPVTALTGREREILAVMAEGRSNQAIAEHLGLTVKTVESHVRSIFTRLDLHPEPDNHRRVLAVLTYLRSARFRL